MLFAAKLAEIGQHLDYLRDTFTWLRAEAYPNLAERLRLRGKRLDAVAREVADLEVAFNSYQPPSSPVLDTWPQLFVQLRTLATEVQSVRTLELPAYLAGSLDEAFYAAVLEALHQALGLADVHPVASLQQGHWFAVIKPTPNYPLYLAPDSLISDPGELPLVFHEIGHVLFQLWGSELPQALDAVLNATLLRKASDIQATADQQVRADKITALREWIPLVSNQLEELTCDTVGVLLGGPAFVVALAVGLFVTATRPFDYGDPLYPPLDCRMRIGGIVLRHWGLADQLPDGIEASWAQVRAVPGTTPPRFYSWLYDETFLHDLTVAVESLLTAKGVQRYQPGCGGLRQQLVDGATARLADNAAYRAWSRSFAEALRRDYALPQSSSSSSSSGSSA